MSVLFYKYLFESFYKDLFESSWVSMDIALQFIDNGIRAQIISLLESYCNQEQIFLRFVSVTEYLCKKTTSE